MTIQCDTLEQFAAMCAAMVREGCTFEANADRLLIVLTGGY